MASSINMNHVPQDDMVQDQQRPNNSSSSTLSNVLTAVSNVPTSLKILGVLSLLGSASAAMTDRNHLFPQKIVNGNFSTNLLLKGDCEISSDDRCTTYANVLNTCLLEPNDEISYKSNGTEFCELRYLISKQGNAIDIKSTWDREPKLPSDCQNLKLNFVSENKELIYNCTKFPEMFNGTINNLSDKPVKIKHLGDCKPVGDVRNTTSKRYDYSVNPKKSINVLGLDEDACSIKVIKTKAKLTDNQKQFSDIDKFGKNNNCDRVIIKSDGTYQSFCKPKTTKSPTTTPSSTSSPTTSQPTTTKQQTTKPTKPETASLGLFGAATIGAGLTVVALAGVVISYKYKCSNGEAKSVKLTPNGETVIEYNARLQQEAQSLVHHYFAKHPSYEKEIHKLWDSIEPVKGQLSELKIVSESNVDDAELDERETSVDMGIVFGQHIYNSLVDRVGRTNVEWAEESYNPRTNLNRYVQQAETRNMIADFISGARNAIVEAGQASINYIFPRRA